MARSLAGTSGIPVRSRRAAVGVVCECDPTFGTRILEVVWPGPPQRRFRVEACTQRPSHGRWDLGTMVRSWEVTLDRRGTRRVVWWEAGEWFVERRTPDPCPPPPPA